MNTTTTGPKQNVLALTLHLPEDLPAFLGDAVAARPLLEIDVLLEDQSTMTAVARVDWCERTGGGEPERLDLGLRLVRLEHGLDRAGPAGIRPGASAARTRRLEAALAHVLASRDAYLGAVRANPTSEEILPEEALYMAALRSARAVLEDKA